jgi:hypothetical protein
VTTFAARAIVAHYRSENLASFGDLGQMVLQRLEADPGDRVSAAFNRLKPPDDPTRRVFDPAPVVFFLLQAVELATNRGPIVSEATILANELRRFANSARDLAAFCDGTVSIHLSAPLLKIAGQVAEELEERARTLDEQPKMLQIVVS